MTGREKLERLVRIVRRFILLGGVLYLVPTFTAYFFPWTVFVAAAGIVVSVAGLVLALKSLRCPECGRHIENLLMVRQEGRFLTLPRDLSVCPHCGFDLDTHAGHEGLPEILRAYEDGGRCFGVINVPGGRGTTRCEVALQGKAWEAIQSVLRWRPFGEAAREQYRYFFAPRSRPAREGKPGSRLTVRVEKAGATETKDIPAPPALVSLFRWLREPGACEQVASMCFQQVD